MRTTLLASAALALAFIAFTPKEAKAGLAIAAELGPIWLLDPPPDTSIGFGFAGRVGYKLGLPLLSLTPEVKVAVHKVPSDTAILALAGGRVSIGALLAPNAFVHVGYGRISVMDTSLSGFSFDSGVGLDFTPIPLVDIGVLLSYNRITFDGGKAHWIMLGAQASIAF